MTALRASIARALRRLDPGCAGSAAAEFAVIIPVLLLLVIGTFEFGRLYWIRSNLQFAAEQTGRWVMVNASPTPSTAAVQTQFNTHLVAVPPTDVTVTTATTPIVGAFGGAQALQITATYSFSFIPALSNLLGLFAGGAALPPLTLTGQSTIPLN